MRGTDERGGSMFSYVSLEDRLPAEHPVVADSACHGQDARANVATVWALISSAGVRRIRRSSCSARRCCRRCIRFAASGSQWSTWIRTCCSAGSSAWESKTAARRRRRL
jgi:hypothetical protein